MPSKKPKPAQKEMFPSHHEGEPLEGVFTVERVTFSNPETGFAVVRLVPAEGPSDRSFVAVGTLGDPKKGECYRLKGAWHHDPQYGWQVRISSAVRELPRSLEAIERYLAGASIKGLGPHYAKALVNYFKERTFEELQAGGPHLEEVPGIGPVRAQMIRQSWADHQGLHELMINLQGLAGLSPSQAQRLYQRYGREAWALISANPYRLAEEVHSFGFKRCDRIGRALGIAHDAPARIQAGIIYLLQKALEEGHLWMSTAQVIAEGASLLEVKEECVREQIPHLIEEGRLTLAQVGEPPEEALLLPQVDRAEQLIAERLYSLLQSPASLSLSEAQAEQLLERWGHPQLTPEQKLAVLAVLKGVRIVILTGGPGTGKTTTIRSLLSCLEAARISYALCATTGRASKQLESTTGRLASTVHRHLRLGMGYRNSEPLREQVLVIDEASMIDLWLMAQIVERLTPRNQLFLVGDVDQLPSVGPGAILQDLITIAQKQEHPNLQVVHLERIFRQEAGSESLIVLNCHRIRQGHRPLKGSEQQDYFEIYRETPEEARDLVVELVSTRLPRFLHVPPEEIQVLAPMHGGAAGVDSLNRALQSAVNPPSSQKAELLLRRGEEPLTFREGDRVRQTRNNYRKGVFNGDLGRIIQIDLARQVLSVRFEDTPVDYSFDELDELVHAWAMTVHSAQGSQWPAVIIVMLKQHYVMLERNILYTALSRAQRLAVLITQEQAVRIAVQRNRARQRRTLLAQRIANLLTAV
ncbi:MAG: ATP-dependent RecD-like DNA helicase [Anaerolineae bacterium]|nr:ATP-dependent RecD-like DNA helicase [Anaerolineae bacterium]